MNNYEYISVEEFLDLMAIVEIYDTQIMKKHFIRFLKENGIFCRYKKLYYNSVFGFIYRKTMYKAWTITSLESFLSSIPWEYYIIDAFEWDENEYWHSIHRKWLNYINNEKRNLGAI